MSAPIAVQLYSLREEIQSDLHGVIHRLADIGYVGVEPFGGLDHHTLAKLLKDHGLVASSAHLGLPIDQNNRAALDAAEAYGIKRIVVPWQPEDRFTTVDGIKQVTDELNEAARFISQYGYELGYHNHWAEVGIVEGRPAYQIMFENLEPNVFFEIDTYWVRVGGLDPAAVVKEMGSRAPLLHIKDGPGVRGQAMLAAGEGVMDFPAIIEASGGNAEYLIVELDYCDTDMMTAVEKSFGYLTSKGLGHGR
jgi:sugar phosphate isomerase/epimerase